MKHAITGSLSRDITAFYLPSLLIALLLPGLAMKPELLAIAAFVLFYVIDTGHNFVTGLRAFRRVDTESLVFAALVPLVFGCSIFLLDFAELWFFRFMIYFTFFHHVRQYYGLSAWYQKINQRFDAPSKFFLQVLTSLPFLAMHFRLDQGPGGYLFDPNELLLWPSPTLYLATMGLFGLVLLIWLSYEARTYRRVGLEANRLLSMALPISLHTMVFFSGTSFYAMIFPLIVGHGISYMVLTGLSMQRLALTPLAKWQVTCSVVGLATLGGASVYAVDHWQELHAALPRTVDSMPWGRVLLALSTVPPLWHYIVDSRIWKGRHRDASLIYTVPSQHVRSLD